MDYPSSSSFNACTSNEDDNDDAHENFYRHTYYIIYYFAINNCFFFMFICIFFSFTSGFRRPEARVRECFSGRTTIAVQKRVTHSVHNIIIRICTTRALVYS